MKRSQIQSYYEKSWQDKDGIQMSEKIAKFGYDTALSLVSYGTRCLDMGCGDGSNSLKLSELGYIVDGCDISHNAVEKAKKKGINAKMIDLNLKVLPFKPNSYDFVWVSDVIEHLIEPKALLLNINRILKKGGYLFLSTPNVNWYGIKIQCAFGTDLDEIHPGHISWFGRKSIERLLKDTGFEIDLLRTYRRFIPFPVTRKFPGLERFNNVGRSFGFFDYTYGILSKLL